MLSQFTRREQFLLERNKVAPRKKLYKYIGIFYPKAGNPKSHLRRKGKQWHFSMKARIDENIKSKQIHSVSAITFNVRGSQVL